MSVSLRKVATAFGVVFILVGLAGYVEALTPNGRLFGLFAVDNEHNLIHFASGVAALIAASLGELPSWRYFQAFTLVNGLVTVLGFFGPHGDLLCFVAHNVHDIWLHALITAASAYFGFYRGPRLGHA